MSWGRRTAVNFQRSEGQHHCRCPSVRVGTLRPTSDQEALPPSCQTPGYGQEPQEPRFRPERWPAELRGKPPGSRRRARTYTCHPGESPRKGQRRSEATHKGACIAHIEAAAPSYRRSGMGYLREAASLDRSVEAFTAGSTLGIAT
jgi:hypothetical protein